jgi:hypothetical protein
VHETRYPALVQSRHIIIALGAGLALSLLLIAFLLGRESARPPSLPLPPPSTKPTLAAPTPPAATPPEASPSPFATATPPPPVPAPPSPPPSPSPSPSPEPRDLAPDKQAIARYFREVDQLQNVDVDNPEAAASSLINGASNGDTSGLRALVKQARDAEAKAAALTPPAPCAQYHRQLLRVMTQSREMLQQLERGIAGGDVEALPALLGQANAMKSQAEALAHEERAIKSRFGLPR